LGAARGLLAAVMRCRGGVQRRQSELKGVEGGD
jgi:hypothetical protein